MKACVRFARSPRRLQRFSGIVAALTAYSVSFSVSAWAQNPCSLVSGAATPTAADITAATQMALGNTPCTANIEGAHVCTVITVQRVINASQGQPCSVYNAHAAVLSWTASTTQGATYNVYRAASASGPFTTPLNSAPITGTTYTDTTVQAGQTYFYVVAAVAGGQQSAFSNAVQGTIPTP